MTAAVQNLYIDQGATFQDVITWNDSNGNPVNNTGYTAKMYIKQNWTDATPILELTSASGALVLGGSNGQIQVNIANSVTLTLPLWFTGLYDLEMTSASGVVTRLMQGGVTVNPGVSL